jgi:hypothetical protein
MGSGSKENYEANVQTQINNQINPPVVTPPLPWSSPTITSQPQNLTVNTGSIATFTVSATGKPTPTYQWQFDDTTLTDETNTSLVSVRDGENSSSKNDLTKDLFFEDDYVQLHNDYLKAGGLESDLTGDYEQDLGIIMDFLRSSEL